MSIETTIQLLAAVTFLGGFIALLLLVASLWMVYDHLTDTKSENHNHYMQLRAAEWYHKQENTK